MVEWRYTLYTIQLYVCVFIAVQLQLNASKQANARKQVNASKVLQVYTMKIG